MTDGNSDSFVVVVSAGAVVIINVQLLTAATLSLLAIFPWWPDVNLQRPLKIVFPMDSPTKTAITYQKIIDMYGDHD